MALPKFASLLQEINFLQTQWAAILDPIIKKVNDLRISTPATLQVFRSGLGNYTLPVNPSPIFLILELQGGGGGGGGAGTVSPGTGGQGGATSFGPWQAGGGGGGSPGTGSAGSGAGGLPSVNSGNPQITFLGQSGASAIYASNSSATPMGGLGGGIGGGRPFPNANGGAGVENSGGGGAGAGGNPATSFGGGGGAEGSKLKQIITNPLSLYNFVVGEGGTSGVSGNVATGGAGARGLITVWEFYQ